MLDGRGLAAGAEDLVKSLESTLGPHNEATNVATRSQLKQVQGLDGAQVDSGNVAESPRDTVVLVVHNQRAQADDVAAVAHLANTGANLLGILMMVRNWENNKNTLLFSISALAPSAVRRATAFLVVEIFSMPLSTTRGTWGRPEIR